MSKSGISSFSILVLLGFCTAAAAQLLLGAGDGKKTGGGGGGGCCTLVSANYAEVADGSGTTSIATAAFNAIAGNLIVVGCRNSFSGGMVVTVTDTALNTYTAITSASDSGNDLFSNFYAKNITGNAANVVTCHYDNNGQYISVQAVQYSGASTSAPLDTFSSGVQLPDVTSVTSDPFSTSAATAIAVCMGANGNTSNTYTAGAGYTLRGTNTGLSFTEDQQFTVTQTNVTCSVSWVGAKPGEIVAAVFK